MHKLLFIVLAILIIFVSGCQPSPEADIITQKLDVLSNSDSQMSSDKLTPSFYTETINDKGIKIIFDATISVPDKKSFRIPKIKAEQFRDEDVTRFIDVLFKGKTPISLMNPLTKAQYEELYLTALEDLHYMQQNPQNGVDIGILEEQVAYYMHKVETAPESDEEIIPFPPDKLQTMRIGRVLRSSADLGRDTPAVIEITTNDSTAFMEFNNGPSYMDVSMSYPELVSASPNNIQITKLDAQKLADNLMEVIGEGRYTCSAYMVGVVSNAGLYDTIDDYKQQCHRFVYTEVIDGIPVTFTEKLHTASPEEGYNNVPVWSYVAVCVDDGGIAGVRWEGNNEVIGFEQQDMPIISFASIINTAKQNLDFTYAWSEEYKIREIMISEIILGYMPILQKNNNEHNIVVPVWDFFGVIQYEAGEWNEHAGYNSLLTINALDGTIINRDLGY